MNGTEFEALVHEVIERVTGQQKQKALDEAELALSSLDNSLAIWREAQLTKADVAQTLANAKAALEAAEAELVLEASVEGGAINGKNAETRKLQTTQLLATEAKSMGSYGQAFRAHSAAQADQDQAVLSCAIAEKELDAAKTRCRVVESILNTLSVE